MWSAVSGAPCRPRHLCQSVIAALLLISSGISSADARGIEHADVSVLGDEVTFYVDPDSRAAEQANERREERPDDAAAMDVLAAQPVADWFGDWLDDVEGAVAERVTEITSAGALPVLVAYNIPYRDCGKYSAGG